MQATISRPSTEVLSLSGHLNGSNAADLQEQLHQAVTSNTTAPLLIDMSQVESLDSAGLMAFVSAQNQAQRLNRQLSLCGISPSVRIIFELTQLDRVFKIFDNCATFEAEISL